MLPRKSPRTPAFGRPGSTTSNRAISAPKCRGPARKRTDAKSPRPYKDIAPGDIRKPPRPICKPIRPDSDLLDTSFPSVSTTDGDISRIKTGRTPSPCHMRSHMQRLSRQFELDKPALARSVYNRMHSSGPSLDLNYQSSDSRRTHSICWGQGSLCKA